MIIDSTVTVSYTAAPIRIAHIADTHIDETRRLEDTRSVLQAFVDQIREAGVDLVVHAGDFFERKSTPAERNLLAWFLRTVCEHVPLVGVRGNHDFPGDLDVFNQLDTLRTCRIFTRPTLAPGSAEVVKLPGDRAVAVLAMPWFDKAAIAARMPASATQQEVTDAVNAKAREMLTLFRAEADRQRAQGAVTVLVGHCNVAGAVVSTGQTMIGHGPEFGARELQECATLVALGHIHKAQDCDGERVVYSGSTERANFGETEPKGWYCIEVDKDTDTVDYLFRDLPAREIVHATSVDPDPDGVPAGSLVRVRVEVLAEHLHELDQDLIRQRYIDAGAHSVKIEPVVIHQTRVRSEAIVDARDTWDRVSAYFDAKQVDVDDEQRERLQAKLRHLESGDAKTEVAA